MAMITRREQRYESLSTWVNNPYDGHINVYDGMYSAVWESRADARASHDYAPCLYRINIKLKQKGERE